MKKIYTLGLLASIIGTSCTPETEELKVLREEKPSANMNVSNPPVDLSYTVVTFLSSQVEKEVRRDIDTKLIDDTSFSFAPSLINREVQSGESVVLEISATTSQYERTLPESSYTIEKNQVNTANSGEEFKVTLKNDAFKDLDITNGYAILLQMKIVSATPSEFPVKIVEKGAIYKIKLNFVEKAKFPEGDNIEILTAAPSPAPTLIAKTGYSFESNYASGHVNKLKDNDYTGGTWWIKDDATDSNGHLPYLYATFNQPTVVKGIKITQHNNRTQYIGEMKIMATDKNDAEYDYGTYTYNTSVGRVVYLQFKQPVEVRYLLFYDFKNNGNAYIDIHEIEFY